MIEEYIVYVKVDEENRIVAINSSAFLSDVESWIEIDRGSGDKYHHAQGNYLDNFLMDDRGVYRYKLVDGVVVERTQEEMDGDYEEPEEVPSVESRVAELEAQLAAYEAAYMEGVQDA